MKFNRSFIKSQGKTPKLKGENNVHQPPQQLKIVDQSVGSLQLRGETCTNKRNKPKTFTSYGDVHV